MSDHYDASFFALLSRGATASARQIMPIVLEFVDARSVVDVGCGTGAWLAVAAEHGIEDFLGIDGEWVDAGQLQIPEERFVARDLREPLQLGRRFDLAMSLEVAEHLPPESAETFVESLTRLAPAVLFSAAIPWQGGVNHVNEQWPEYWARTFRSRGFRPLDVIRPRVWHNTAVEWWYAQNTLLFVADDVSTTTVSGAVGDSAVDALVHPCLWTTRQNTDNATTRDLLRDLPRAVRRSLLWRVRSRRAASCREDDFE
jgi:SAM-dependent methyltransferase